MYKYFVTFLCTINITEFVFKNMELTEEQKQRIEDNRKKALLIRQEKSKIKPIVHPYEK